MVKHSSDDIDPAQHKAYWNKIIVLIEQDLADAKRILGIRIAERKKAVDAAKLAIEQVHVLESKIKDLKKSRDRGDNPGKG